jgi:hypothetical protein
MNSCGSSYFLPKRNNRNGCVAMCGDKIACGLKDEPAGGLQPMPAKPHGAGRWLAVWLALPVLVMGLVLADSLVRTQRQVDQAGRWMRALGLSAPAFQPSGTAVRHPELGCLAVDTRFDPFLPLNGAAAWPVTPKKVHEN